MESLEIMSALEVFSKRGLLEAGNILRCYADGKYPYDLFWGKGVHLEYNQAYDNVYLTNDNYEVLRYDKESDSLYMFYVLSWDGHEGDVDSLWSDFENGNIAEENYDQLADILENEGKTDEAEQVREAIRKCKGNDDEDEDD